MKRLLTIFFGLLAATTAMQAANVINNDTFWKTTMVTGNYCLNIQDKVDYTRKVSQTDVLRQDQCCFQRALHRLNSSSVISYFLTIA